MARFSFIMRCFREKYKREKNKKEEKIQEICNIYVCMYIFSVDYRSEDIKWLIDICLVPD